MVCLQKTTTRDSIASKAHLIDGNGTKVVEYTYDAWGKLISTTGTLATSLGADNPFRYRGYYYDTETGLYYLMTRYYDPEVCRFISADVYMTTGQGVLGGNMWAYCLNNPLIYDDDQGGFGILGTLLVGAAIGAVFGGVFGGITSLANGEGFWKGAVSGAISGAFIGLATSIVPGVLSGALGGAVGGAFGYLATTPIDEWNWKDGIGAALENAVWGGLGGGIAKIGAPAGSSILTSSAVNVTVAMSVEPLHTAISVSSHHIQERISTKSEKKKTINRPFSPRSPKYRTQVYAPPAAIPPKKPQTLANKFALAKVGLIMQSAPKNATTIAIACLGRTFSLIKTAEKSSAKKGLILLSIDASLRSSRSMA